MTQHKTMSSVYLLTVFMCSFWLQCSEILYRSDSGPSKHSLVINCLTYTLIWVLQEQQDQEYHEQDCWSTYRAVQGQEV